MKILLTGATGGIGSAIKEALKEHDLTAISRSDAIAYDPRGLDWVIFAQGTINEKDPHETFNVNTVANIHFTQILLPFLKKGIIYISSTAGIKGNSKFPVYAASKAALNCYAVSMAKAHPELSFFALCPGPTDTRMWRSLGLEGVAQKPAEVAKAVQRIMAGEFQSGAIITVRNGEVSV